jgi:maltose alpha-D-glucosyltransferase/alpha-amylase
VKPLAGGALWYKDAIIYEVHVRAFRDSSGDGVGDFQGLVEKLDYLYDLGVTALWLLPFYPSPGRDDGYDIASYTDVNPRYGTLDDFKLFLDEAHRRGLRVITELVVNHTSDQHPWFQRARRAPPGDPHRDFYVWSDTDQRFREARIIFKDFETSNWAWDPIAGAWYWHRFYSHQPDLNYDNPEVWKAVLEVLDFWLRMGIDGLRLDAIPYLYEREGTNCENLPETHDFLRALRSHVDQHFPERMLLAEANQWPEDAVAYFGAGDECHMAFHFPVMPRLFMSLRMEDRLPIEDILRQTPPIPGNCQWAMFLRNHDELTLEMVTDEDRDYMYRVYARDPQARINLGIRRRLAPLLENHRARIELMNGLLFSLPGTPVLYYGDEIGMGDNIYLGDRNGVRTPMQWSAERNAGFSRANPQSLYLPLIIDPEYHYQAVNVEVHQNNPHSLLWWMKRLIDLRKRHPAFGRGDITFLQPANPKVLAFLRTWSPQKDGETGTADDILVVANLSRLTQYVELDLSAFQGRIPVELLGRTEFPIIGDRPYLLTLSPCAFYWFGLEKQTVETTPDGSQLKPAFVVPERWDAILQGSLKDLFEEWLPDFLAHSRWFADGRRVQIEAAMVLETLPLPSHLPAGNGEQTGAFQLALIQVEFSDGDPETYFLPLAFFIGPHAEHLRYGQPQAVIAQLEVPPRNSMSGEWRVASGEQQDPSVLATHHSSLATPLSGLLCDPAETPPFARAVVDLIAQRGRLRRAGGELIGVCFPDSGELLEASDISSFPAPLRGEQRNTSISLGDRLILKIRRRLEEGLNPEIDIGRFLAERTQFRHTPRLVGLLEYRRSWGEPITLAILHEFVPHQADGWRFTLDALSRYFEQALARPEQADQLPLPQRPLLALAAEPIPRLAQELIGNVLEVARITGQRTAELHLALASATEDSAFLPEPFTSLYQRSLYQSLRSQTRQLFASLRRHLGELPEDVRAEAQQLADQEEVLLDRVRRVYEQKIQAQRIRCHGDLTLREILWTGRDVVLIDFEGNPSRPLSDRRRKYTPLRDVASMVRSFHYAALHALSDARVRREDRHRLVPWAWLWHLWTSVAFLTSYRETAGSSAMLPARLDQQEILLDFYLVKRSLNELRHELNRNPTRAEIPIRGLMHLLRTPPLSTVAEVPGKAES